MVGLEPSDKDYENRINNYAKDTMQEVEQKSKMFCTTVNNIAGVMTVRQQD